MKWKEKIFQNVLKMIRKWGEHLYDAAITEFGTGYSG